MRAIQFMIGTYGGAERFFVRLSQALAARGLEQLIIVNDNPDLVQAVSSAQLNYRALELSRFGSLVDRYAVGKFTKAFQPDVFVSWMNRAGRRQPKGPHVNVGRLGGYYPTKNYRACDYLIANTPDIASTCRTEGWPSDRVRVISNFTDDFGTVERASSMRERPLRICALGRFDAWKGFDTLIDAIAKIGNATLVLAGQGGQEAALREQVARLGLESRVSFPGWINDRAQLFAVADVCVVPSTHEPLGNVILEAWSAGCPVIAAGSQGPKWLIENGRTGLLFDPGDVESLVAALDVARLNPATRSAWAAAGRHRWETEFAIDAICRQYMDFFWEISEAKHRRP